MCQVWLQARAASNLGSSVSVARAQAPTESANEQSSVPPPVAAVKDQCTAALSKQDYIVLDLP